MLWQLLQPVCHLFKFGHHGVLCISVRCYYRIQQQEQAIEVSSVVNIVQYQEGNVNMTFIE
jgi:hypothetical protein